MTGSVMLRTRGVFYASASYSTLGTQRRPFIER
jgi:hypothetical protein